MRWVDLAGCSLIAVLGLYGVISPRGMYELSYKLGNDNHRRWSPERGPLYLWMTRTVASVMFLIGLGMCVLVAISK
jgi:ABC-type phosphate transport system auxiliary subunit